MSSSKVIRDNAMVGMDFYQTLSPIHLSMCPRQKKRSAECPLCDYIRDKYPNITDGNQVEQAIEEAFRAAKQQGYEEGRSQAVNEVKTEMNAYLTQIESDVQTFMERICRAFDEYHAGIEPQLVGIVFEIVRKVLKTEVKINPTAVLSVVRDSLKRVAKSETVVIKVNTADLESVRQNNSDFMALMPNIKQLEINEDPRVEPGGCLIETDLGIVDARLDSQLIELQNNLDDKAA